MCKCAKKQIYADESRAYIEHTNLYRAHEAFKIGFEPLIVCEGSFHKASFINKYFKILVNHFT